MTAETPTTAAAILRAPGAARRLGGIPVMERKERRFYGYAGLVLAAAFVGATALIGFNPFETLLRSVPMLEFITTEFLPPTINRPGAVARAVFTTVALAITSASVAGVLAFLAALLGSAKVSPVPWLAAVIRGIATFMRNIPDLVWAFILFVALGIGTGTGFAALVITTFAFLTRAFIETIDEVSTDSTEGLLVVGAGFWQRVVQSIWPSCIKDFISWFLYSVEVNIRSATIVGMVGGGGIGLVLFSSLRRFRYAEAAGIILVLAALVVLVDLLTTFLRKKVLDHG